MPIVVPPSSYSAAHRVCGARHGHPTHSIWSVCPIGRWPVWLVCLTGTVVCQFDKMASQTGRVTLSRRKYRRFNPNTPSPSLRFIIAHILRIYRWGLLLYCAPSTNIPTPGWSFITRRHIAKSLMIPESTSTPVQRGMNEWGGGGGGPEEKKNNRYTFCSVYWQHWIACGKRRQRKTERTRGNQIKYLLTPCTKIRKASAGNGTTDDDAPQQKAPRKENKNENQTEFIFRLRGPDLSVRNAVGSAVGHRKENDILMSVAC